MASPDFSANCMVALYPPLDVAKALAVDGGLTPEKIHVTVVYCGKAADVDADVLREVAVELSERQPFTASISGHARFTGDDQDVIVAIVDAPELEELRRETLDLLRERGIRPPREHGYVAHMTLTFLDKDEPSPVERLEVEAVEFTALSAKHAKDRTDYPLEHPIAAPAREAFAAGWALSGGPMTGRVKAASRAAVQTAIEHADDPHILEVTIDLGKLEGMWAKLFGRREEKQAEHTRLVTDAWRTLIDRDAVAAMVDAHRMRVGLGESLSDFGAEALAAARAMLRALADLAGWTALRTAIRDAIAAGRAEGMVNAVAIAAERVSVVGLDWNIAFGDAYRSLERLDELWGDADGWLGRMVDRAAGDLGRVLAQGAEDGASRDEMIDAAMDVLASDDVEAVAFTVDWAMTTAADDGALRLYQSEGVQQIDVITAGDGHVCFPAGTPVRTPTGDVSIDKLSVGDLVETPRGPKPVVRAGKRPYSGTMVVVEAGGSQVAATADHPFWTPEGWKSAGSLSRGDILKSAEDVLIQVDRVHHLNFRQTDHPPTEHGECGITASISFPDAGMPVSAVRFQGGREVGQREVDGPSVDPVLLDEPDSKPFEGLPDASLQPVLASEPSIAGDGAELPGSDITGADALTDSAVAAGVTLRRPTASLGAVAPVQVLLGPEVLAAAGAVDVLRVDGLALLGADRVPALDTGLHGEVNAADRAVLGDLIGAPGLVTGSRAVAPSRIPATSRIEDDFAASACPERVDDGGSPLALPRAVDARQGGSGFAHDFFTAAVANVVEGQGGLSHSLVTSGELVEVYDIEVADEHVFYASGLLVHNCGPCSDFEVGSPWASLDVPRLPTHPRCRCCYAAAVSMSHFAGWFA